jgi:CheY-like chemotaxis protein
MRRSGHAVDWQADGLAAASVLRYQSFDLVVLDIGLPKLDGLRVLAGMRERGDSTPVLMLTARDGIEDRVQALDVGADDYLGKPFDFREFSALPRAVAACAWPGQRSGADRRLPVRQRRAPGQPGRRTDRAAQPRIPPAGDPTGAWPWSARTRSATACSASMTKPGRTPSSCISAACKKLARRCASPRCAASATCWKPADGRADADGRAARAGPLRRTLLLYLGALLAVFAVALLFAARDYGQRAANRSYDHLLVSSALSIADSVALVDGQWQVDLPYAALDLLAMAPEDRVFYRVADSRGT